MGFGRNAYGCVWGREGVKAAMHAYANNIKYRNVFSCILTNWLLSAIKLSDIRLQLCSLDASREIAHPKVAGSTPNVSERIFSALASLPYITVPSHSVARVCRVVSWLLAINASLDHNTTMNVRTGEGAHLNSTVAYKGGGGTKIHVFYACVIYEWPPGVHKSWVKAH